MLDSATQQTTTRLTGIVRDASRLGLDIVELAGFLDEVDERARAQLHALAHVQEQSDLLQRGQARARQAVATVVEQAGGMDALMDTSVTRLEQSFAQADSIAVWVATLARRMVEVSESLEEVRAAATLITRISTQVRLLAINAKIEATHAGDAGRGFSVVADAVNELSDNTTGAAQKIGAAIEQLSGWVSTLTDEAQTTATGAQELRSNGMEMTGTLEKMRGAAQDTRQAADLIGAASDEAGKALDLFLPRIGEMTDFNSWIGDRLRIARDRTNALIDGGEAILQSGVSLGGDSADARFIAAVRDDAARIGALFEEGIARGRISREELFSRRYTPIPGSAPEQVMAPFTAFTDKVLPAVQEAALELDPSVVFCAAINLDGYLPTHNRKFSHPQGPDPVENAARSRNRRMFDDRVGLKAGRNTAPFLLQVYRRDMGGGTYKMMKDVSAPILVNGTHWGGLRLAYTA